MARSKKKPAAKKPVRKPKAKAKKPAAKTRKRKALVKAAPVAEKPAPEKVEAVQPGDEAEAYREPKPERVDGPRELAVRECPTREL